MDNSIRTWKQETDRQGSSVEKQVVLPANLAEEIDLTDEELEAVYGAWDTEVDNTNSNTATSGSISSATGGTALLSEFEFPITTI